MTEFLRRFGSTGTIPMFDTFVTIARRYRCRAVVWGVMVYANVRGVIFPGCVVRRCCLLFSSVRGHCGSLRAMFGRSGDGVRLNDQESSLRVTRRIIVVDACGSNAATRLSFTSRIVWN